MAEAPDLPSFHREALAGLRKAVPCDVGLIGFADPDAGRGGAVVDDPPGAVGDDAMRGFRHHVDQEPTVVHQVRRSDPPALMISDFVSQRRWVQSNLYNECHRSFGGRHVVVVKLSGTRPPLVSAALARANADFSDRDRELLTLLRPHLAVASENAHLRQLWLTAERSQVAAGGIALLGEAGTILAVDVAAEQLLAAYFSAAGRPRYLPEDLAGWARAERERLRQVEDLAPPGPALCVGSERGRLYVRFLPGRGAEPDALHLFEVRRALDERALRAQGLTRREVEVLELVAQGMQDKGIANELGVSVRTVRKHSERVRAKLRAPNRTAAVARAREVGRLHP